MARRQSDDLVALLIAEVGIVLNEHGAHRPAGQRDERGFDLTGVSGAKDRQLQRQRNSSGPRIAHTRFDIRIGGIHKKAMVTAVGTNLCRSSSRFLISTSTRSAAPVMLPPGRF